MGWEHLDEMRGAAGGEPPAAGAPNDPHRQRQTARRGPSASVSRLPVQLALDEFAVDEGAAVLEMNLVLAAGYSDDPVACHRYLVAKLSGNFSRPCRLAERHSRRGRGERSGQAFVCGRAQEAFGIFLGDEAG